MRQAGRYLPEYRALRQKHTLLELCHTPDLAAAITLQPIRRFAVDAAILFADILLPFEPLGLGLSFAAGEGPQIARPLRDAAAVRALPALDPEESLGDVLPHSRKALALAAAAEGGGGVPVIHFGTGTGPFLEDFAAAGGDVVGVDWRVPLDAAWRRLRNGQAIQGNLDPAALLAPREVLRRQVREVLDLAGGRPGHVFNLGHGIVPETPPDAVAFVVELVHGG